MLTAARGFLAWCAPLAVATLWAITGSAADAVAPGGRAIVEPPPSIIERAFSDRAEAPLRLFGHDLFLGADEALAGAGPMVGAVGGDQILGFGDELTVTVRGPKQSHGRYVITNEGQLLVPDLPPIRAAGRRLDEVRDELKRAYTDSQLVADVFVYLTEVRRIGVLVVGAVTRPGRIEVTPFSTALDALMLAGGVRRDGALRSIQLHRRGSGRRVIDLYQLLLSDTDGETVTPRLADGDRIVVPPLGPTVAIAGPVKRPGIYELPPDEPTIALDQLVTLAGGALRPSTHRALRLTIGVDGRERAQTLVADSEVPLRDGDLLVLSPLLEDRRGLAHLEGAALRPGPRGVGEAGTLAGLARAADLRPDAYRPFAVVISPAATGGPPLLSAVDLDRLAAGRGDRALMDGERLVVLGAAEIAFLSSEAVLALFRGDPLPKDPPPCAGLVGLARALAANPMGALANGQMARAAVTLVGDRSSCPPVFADHPDLLAFTLTHSALARGDTRRPGFYPVADALPLARLAELAGAAQGRGRGSSAARAGDVVDLTGPSVTLIGHVREPGAVSLARAPSLKALLGGGRVMADGAYPLIGIIERFSDGGRSRRLLAFAPASVANGASDTRLMDGDRVHVFSAALVRAMMNGDAPASASTRGGAKAEAVEAGHLFEPPDGAMRAFLAERAVRVRGAVHQPASLPVAGAASLSALIAQAGGVTPTAETTSIEITWPEAAKPRQVVSLRHDGGLAIPVGAAIRVSPTPGAVEGGAVLIGGEVRHPGYYDIARGERLSSLLQRAGGMTEHAYAIGTVFTRESAKAREKASLEERARGLDREVERLTRGGQSANQREVELARRLASDLRGVEPLGRVVVEVDPDTLARHPDRDLSLEPGDRITVPKRPATVAVMGEVMAPGGYAFRAGKDASDYLADAGGVSGWADTDRAYLVMPDGRAQPIGVSSWNHRAEVIPPGATLVVPTDPRPYGGREMAQSLANVLGQLALTAASIKVISQ